MLTLRVALIKTIINYTDIEFCNCILEKERESERETRQKIKKIKFLPNICIGIKTPLHLKSFGVLHWSSDMIVMESSTS